MKSFNKHNQSSNDFTKYKEESGIEKLIGVVAFIGFIVVVAIS